MEGSNHGGGHGFGCASQSQGLEILVPRRPSGNILLKDVQIRTLMSIVQFSCLMKLFHTTRLKMNCQALSRLFVSSSIDGLVALQTFSGKWSWR